MWWRNVGRQLRLFGVDGRSIFLILIWLYHMSWGTFWFMVIGFVTLSIIERRGYTVPNALRKIQVLIAGPHRPLYGPRRTGRSDR